jgi:hypothetical protein
MENERRYDYNHRDGEDRNYDQFLRCQNDVHGSLSPWSDT